MFSKETYNLQRISNGRLLRPKWDIHTTLSSPKSQKSSHNREDRKTFKNQRQWRTTDKQCFLGTTGHLHVWTDSSHEYLHKSEPDKIPAWMGKVGTQSPTPSWGAIDKNKVTTKRGRITFSNVAWGATHAPVCGFTPKHTLAAQSGLHGLKKNIKNTWNLEEILVGVEKKLEGKKVGLYQNTLYRCMNSQPTFKKWT